jgi:hypothetical protein
MRFALSVEKRAPSRPQFARAILALTIFAQMIGAAFSATESPNVVGRWKVEITFAEGESRSLRFEARESGQGSFLLLDPKSNYWGPARPSDAKWTQGGEGSVMFSGPVEFPLGNVGRDAGTLVLKGKFGTGDSISGEAMFFRSDQDPSAPESKPSKSGSFKATRVAG